MEITTHESNDCNRAIALSADERDPENGNASHVYSMTFAPQDPKPTPAPVTLHFQHGPIGERGVNGITNEALLAVVIDRLEGFQSGRWACDENERALAMCRAAIEALSSRTRARQQRGVEGTSAV